jgi:hypothetical protein
MPLSLCRAWRARHRPNPRAPMRGPPARSLTRRSKTCGPRDGIITSLAASSRALRSTVPSATGRARAATSTRRRRSPSRGRCGFSFVTLRLSARGSLWRSEKPSRRSLASSRQVRRHPLPRCGRGRAAPSGSARRTRRGPQAHRRMRLPSPRRGTRRARRGRRRRPPLRRPAAARLRPAAAAASTVVVDPAKVVRLALRDAGSIADLLITIERCARAGCFWLESRFGLNEAASAA